MAQPSTKQIQKVGIAGLGAIGSAVARALTDGIDGLEWVGASDINPHPEFPDIPMMDFDTLIDACDIIVEALPPASVSALAIPAIKAQKTLIMISSCALLIYPEIMETHRDINKDINTQNKAKIIVPSGALSGLDGVKALNKLGIKSSVIASTKKPSGFQNAPFVDKSGIDLAAITTRTKLFEGDAIEAAKGFPANVNVAATLSLAGIGAQNTKVEIWADPDVAGNTHEFKVTGEFSTIEAKITNTPDPANPKSSMLAAQSIIACLEDINNAMVVL